MARPSRRAWVFLVAPCAVAACATSATDAPLDGRSAAPPKDAAIVVNSSAAGDASGTIDSGSGDDSSGRATNDSGAASDARNASDSTGDDGGDSTSDDGGDSSGAVEPARTPPMGWNSWNFYGANISEQVIEAAADAVVSSGMAAAGYQYVNIDDGWAASRDANGNIVANATKFPDGIAAVAAYVHGKGLKMGIYTCEGTETCQGLPGSYGHEAQDAATYASWGIDYVKDDFCNTTGEDPQTQYTLMSQGIVASGRPMVFSLCDAGQGSPWMWGPGISNLWRTTDDIQDSFDSMTSNLDSDAEHASAAGPGHWNDPDMLEVGNGGMSTDEYTSHFSLWAIVGAPLIAGNDLTSMTTDTTNILLNSEVIAVNQDPAGVQGSLVADDGNGDQVWSKPLSTPGMRAVALFNRGSAAATITARWTDLGLASGSATVRDLWAHQDLGPFEDSYATLVASHAVAMITVTGGEGPPPAPPAVYAAASAANTLSGAAALAACAVCATGEKVGYIGTSGSGAGTLQFNGVESAAGGLTTIVIQYLSGENRSASVSVNGGAPLTVQFGESGPDGDFNWVGTHVLQVPLSAGKNALLFSNAAGYAPDMAGIEVYP